MYTTNELFECMMDRPRPLIERLEENWTHLNFVMSVYPDSEWYIIINKKYVVNLGKKHDIVHDYEPQGPWIEHVVGTVGEFLLTNKI